MSHYPSTAELARFRTFMTKGRIVRMSFSDYATDTEVRYGIGWTARSLAYGVTPPGVTIHAEARREASRMRHDGYWLNLCIVCKVWNGPEGCDCYGPAI